MNESKEPKLNNIYRAMKAAALVFFVIIGIYLYFNSSYNVSPYKSKAYSSGQDLLVFAQRTKAPAMTFSVKNATGGTERLKLSQLEGQVVYINFWANWCPPCKEEIPFLAKLENELQSQGLRLFLVNVDSNDKDRDEASMFIREKVPGIKNVFDKDGLLQKPFTVQMLPHHLVIDKRGQVASEFYGDILDKKGELKSMLQRLLTENLASSD